MGTSKAYKGRPDTGRLLPPEAQPPTDDVPSVEPPSTLQNEQQSDTPAEEIRRPEITFEQARRAFNRLMTGLRNGAVANVGGGAAHTARNYVRASGGSRTAAQAGSSGLAGARSLGSFLGAVTRDGLAVAVARFNVQALQGQPPAVVLARLLDALLPGAATREAVIARSCLASALERWLEQHDIEGRGVEALEHTTSAEIPDLMRLYLTEYVHARMLNELVDWAQRTGDDETAEALSDGLLEYIDGKLERHLQEHSDTYGSDAWLDQAEDMADRLFGEVFNLLEDLPDTEGEGE